MTTTLIDCACFHLQVPDCLYVCEAAPSRLSACAGKKDFSRTLEVRVEKKTRYEKKLLFFFRIFRLRWFFLRSYSRRRRKLPIGRYTALIVSRQEEENFHFSAAINLDRDHFLAFLWSNRIHSETTDASHTPLTVLNSLQLLGNYAQAWQTTRDRDDDIRAATLRKHQKNYTRIEEQAADPFHARQNPALFAALQDYLNKVPDLHPYQNGIYTNARLAIGFAATRRDNYQSKGHTRFGGLPDLPPDFAWPRVDTEHCPREAGQGTLCRFVAQINCAELRDMQNYLPARGMLYFFTGPRITENESHRNFCHVLYYDGDASTLQNARDLTIRPEDFFDFHRNLKEPKAARVQAFPYVSILHSANDDMDYPPQNCPRHTDPVEGAGPFSQIEDLNTELTGKPGKTLHAINANISDDFAFSRSPYVEAAKALGGKPQDYVILLKVGAEKKISGFTFGDIGYTYFIIAKERLKHRDFSRVYCHTEIIDYDWD